MLKSVPFDAIEWSSLATELADDVGPFVSLPALGDTPSATGVAAYPTVLSMARRISALSGAPEINVYPIRNFFFGESITVSGLLTGKDMSEQLAGKDLGDELLFPAVMLKADEEIFLDDMTPSELSEKLGGIPVRPSKSDGVDLIRVLLGITE